MKNATLFVLALSFSFLAKSQEPGVKLKDVNPFRFKIDLKKPIGPSRLTPPTVATISNRFNGTHRAINFPDQRIVQSPQDGMPCVMMNTQKIDPKMVLNIITPLPYMPNGYKKFPNREE